MEKLDLDFAGAVSIPEVEFLSLLLGAAQVGAGQVRPGFNSRSGIPQLAPCTFHAGFSSGFLRVSIPEVEFLSLLLLEGALLEEANLQVSIPEVEFLSLLRTEFGGMTS